MNYQIADSDELQDELSHMVQDGICAISFKFLIFIFVLFMFVSSDVFIQRVIGRFDNAVDYKTPTSWGTVLQGAALVAGTFVADTLIRANYI